MGPKRFLQGLLYTNSMEQQRLAYLLQQYADDLATPAELDELQQFIQPGERGELFSTVLAELITAHQPAAVEVSPYEGLARKALEVDKTPAGEQTGGAAVHRMGTRGRHWWQYAAAVFIIAGMGAYLWMSSKKEEQSLARHHLPVPSDIAPGHDGAILTLANGTQVVLDSLGNGVVAVQNGTEVVLTNGRLAYHAGKTAAVSYNTMTTPRGRQFHIQLPDGTLAVLNAASSITYPTAFTGATREVAVTGEVYLEVATDKNQPFVVKVNDQTQIQVLGTRFNVNAYESEEAISTTLLDGAVRVRTHQQLQTLKPGQQAVVAANKTSIQLIDNANVEQVMAWKNGLFNFNGADLKTVMREIGRWYDLDIVYASDPGPREIMGKMQRNLTLAQVMNILKKINIDYRLEGRKLIIK